MKLIMLFLFSVLPLFSAEIVLKDGSAFICDTVSENSMNVNVMYKGQRYVIPRSEIESYQPERNGSHSSFSYSVFQLKDRSELRGVVAEETDREITVKTQLGFIVIPKKEIASRKNPPVKEPELSRVWQSESSSFGNRFGIRGAGLQGSMAGSSPYGTDGGIFAEPDFFRISDRWRFGLSADALQAQTARSEYSFVNASVYIQREFASSTYPLLNFYANLGFGGSQIRYVSHPSQTVLLFTSPDMIGLTMLMNRQQVYSGTAPYGHFEFGWQCLRHGNFFHRLGGRVMSFHDKYSSPVFAGVEYSVGYSL